MKLSLLIPIGAALLVAVPAADAIADTFGELASAMPANASHYALIMEYHGDVYALDTGMALGDCFESLPDNQTGKGISFACEVDPDGGRN